ncbi:zinc finger FYVE domain-containing protein 26 homolog [Anopheles stephensi]|uniref:zinc finger FYVE domain-containing protein 26 homolog n=1 Tax=Anopheles stephensi TaxID=30069 RepID=UPI001658B3F7|nr:zinc finger FYVE domain-containing protein 26 homolog [Anopheles stephensi]
MEHFNEYWELFVDRKDSIAKEIIAYYKTLDDHEDGTELSEQCRRFFRKNMTHSPYPTCQLLKLLAMSKIATKNAVIHDVTTAAVLEAFEQQGQVDRNKCYNILANSVMPAKATNRFKLCILKALERNTVELELLMLALFARKSVKLIVHLLPELVGPLQQQQAWAALDKKQHFVIELLQSSANPPYVHQANYIRFVEQAWLANSGGGTFSPTADGLAYLSSPDKSYLTAYLLELQRCYLIQQNLHLDEALLPPKDFPQHATVLGMMLRAKVDLNETDFAKLAAVIRTNRTLNEQIMAMTNAATEMGNSELMALFQVHAIFALYKAIEASSAGPESALLIATNNLDTQLKCLFKEMDMDTFMQTIESIFTMLFVRGELISAEPPPSMPERKNFMCSVALLATLTSSMKSIMITRKHSATFHEANGKLKQRFQTLYDLVTDVCWRLSLFDEHAPSEGTPLDPKCVRPLHLVDMCPVPTALTHTIDASYGEPSSSSGSAKLFRSVESIAAMDFATGQRHRYGYYGTLPKHKSSRRQTRHPPAATVASSNSGGSNKELQRQGSHSVDTTKTDDRNGAELEHTVAVGSMRSVLGSKKNFTKLFATPETLAVMCLTNGRMSFAKQIIECHNLADRPVGKLVERIEQMQHLKHDLAALIKKTERKQEATMGPFGEAQSSDSNSDVLLDDIRLKTAKGFKISKVLSTLETFLKSQTACTEDEVLAPMDRFVSRYPFLSILTGKNLQLSQVVDIIFNLPFNYELNLAIYNFLLKNAQHTTSMASSIAMSTSIAGHGGETSRALVGNYVAFFGTIIDTLQTAHKTLRCSRGSFTDQHLTIAELLSREVCPLDTMENGMVWKRRASFYDTLERCDELDFATDELERIGGALPKAGGGSASLTKVKQYLEHLTKLLLALQPNAGEEAGTGHGDSTKVANLIRTDVQSLMVERLLEKRISFGAGDTMCGMLGINLVQTLGRRILGPKEEPADERELRKVDGLWEFIASKSELLRRLCTIEIDSSRDDGSVKSPIHNYGKLVRTSHKQELPLGCSYVRPNNPPQTELFPLECVRPCCMLEQKEGKYYTKVESVMQDASMEQKALALLANVDRFAVATEWISASEHLLAAIPKSVHDDDQLAILPATRQRLQQKANELRTYVAIGKFLQLPTADACDGWQNAQTFSAANKSLILHQLIDQGEYRVCAEWIKLHPIDAEKELEMFMYAVHKVLTAANTTTIPPPAPGATDAPPDSDDAPIAWLFRIIETMPIEAVVKLYETIMLNIRSVPVVRYMLEYLRRYTTTKPLYQSYQLSLQIFEHLSREEYDGLWNLASRPLLIIEQCLMNSRLELLSAVIRSIRSLLVPDVCAHCYEHREYIRDLRDAVQQQTTTPPLRRYPVHDGLFISHECVDCLLRVYAGKALEYKVFPDVEPSGDALNGDPTHPLGAASRVSSYDSLSEVGQPFVMPKEIPPRDRWVKDEEALHCMCCRRTFSMLNRRHHCRRCGRVVCHACSKKKLRLQSFYEDVAVRVCDDCWRALAETQPAASAPVGPSGAHPRMADSIGSQQFEWQLTGNERYDGVIRDEYSYEYAPSTSQCLAICNLHTPNEEMASFLLYHCAKLEALLRPLHPGIPNPEIDYALVARMLLNLTLGVKVRGGGAEVEKMKEHAEIILSIVHDNCESLLLHTPSMTNHGSLRKLRDALVKAEKWTLALELSLKCGFSLNGVMAAWGMACLRAGCYETAREKFSHCLPRVASEAECEAVLRTIELPAMIATARQVPIVKRPTRCPPLLNEILYALTCTARLGAPSERVIARVNAARQVAAGTAAASHEPTLNILSTLANLRHICQGEFDGDIPGPGAERLARNDSAPIMCSRLFEESMHYLLAYGSHQSVVQFLMRYQQTEVASLRYILAQRVEPDVFLQTVLLPYLQRGELDTVVQRLSDIDDTLLEWREHLRYVCRYLETNDMLNSLYNLQLLLKDPIRASMTCVRFYTLGCRTFADLHAAEHHLKTSVSHLQNELELCNWQEVRLNSTGRAIETHHSLLMKLDPKELNNHINTILLQLEVTKFLATCEAKGRQTVALLPKIFREASQLPTLFGSSHERLQLAILTLVCGQNVEEAFGLSYRIIQDYNLDTQRVYALTAKYFINHGKVEDVGKLLDVIVGNESSTGASDQPAVVSAICDEIVRVSVDVAIARHGTGVHTKVALEALINRASSVAVRIHCYIASGQLKAAYLLANRHQRTGDIRKILRQAELLGQMHVKRLCEARLNHQESAS